MVGAGVGLGHVGGQGAVLACPAYLMCGVHLAAAGLRATKDRQAGPTLVD